MSTVPMRYAFCIGLSVGLTFGATRIAAVTHGMDVSRAPVPRSNAQSLDAWVDSVRRQHNIPALGAIVFRADTVLARGIARLRRSNSTAPVEAPRNPDERLPPIIWPAGSVELSLDDYAKFLQFNMRGLQGHDTPLLEAATIKHLHTSPVSPPDKYGLGWGLQDFDGALASVHTGSAGAFYAVTIIQPTRDLGAVVFTNAGGERAARAASTAVKALIREFPKVEER